MSAAWYWDASAIISAVLQDQHSPAALRWLRPEAKHIVSSVARHFSLGRSRWSLVGGLRLAAAGARSARGASKLPRLAWSETQAVIARAERAGNASAARAARAHLDEGYWQFIATAPAFEIVPALAQRWALRGADLWHLSLAMTLRAQLPELRLLTFDIQLAEAAAGEGLAPPRK